MSDLKLFRIGGDGVQELEGTAVALERSLQRLIEKNFEALLGLRFLDTEYSTGPKHGGRIDTLGIEAEPLLGSLNLAFQALEFAGRKCADPGRAPEPGSEADLPLLRTQLERDVQDRSGQVIFESVPWGVPAIDLGSPPRSSFDESYASGRGCRVPTNPAPHIASVHVMCMALTLLGMTGFPDNV